MWLQQLPNGTSLHDVVLWVDGVGKSDRKYKTAYTWTNVTSGADVHGGKEIQLDDQAANVISCGDLTRMRFGGTSSFTVMHWVKPVGAAEQGYAISQTNFGGAGWATYMDFSGDKMQFNYNSSTKASNLVFTDTGWVHAALTYSSGAGTFYRNGVAAGTYSGATINGGTANTLIGNRTGGAAAAVIFEGSITNIIVFNKVLTQEQISQVYNKTK